MSKLQSYYNASLKIPPNSPLNFQSTTSKAVSFISNNATVDNYLT